MDFFDGVNFLLEGDFDSGLPAVAVCRGCRLETAAAGREVFFATARLDFSGGLRASISVDFCLDAAVFDVGRDERIELDFLLDFPIPAGGILALKIFDLSPSVGPICRAAGGEESGDIFEIR